MDLELVKLGNQSGNAASVYSLRDTDTRKTLFDYFIEENISHKSELINIIKRLTTIANKTGAREHYFKLNEGKPGDGVCALFDMPNSNLRLYCIRFGATLIILGGGGIKPKSIRTLQQNKKLKDANYLLRAISEQITQRLKERDLKISNSGFDFEGDLNFTTHD